jgi:hypothetical protein
MILCFQNIYMITVHFSHCYCYVILFADILQSFENHFIIIYELLKIGNN